MTQSNNLYKSEMISNLSQAMTNKRSESSDYINNKVSLKERINHSESKSEDNEEIAAYY